MGSWRGARFEYGQCCVDSVVWTVWTAEAHRHIVEHRSDSCGHSHTPLPHTVQIGIGLHSGPLWSTLVHSGPLYSALVRVDIGLGLLSVARGTRQSQAYSSIPILRREVLVLFRLAWHEFLQTCKLVFWPWLDSEGSDLGDLTSAMPCTARPADIDSEGPSSAELSRSSSRRGLASGWLVS
jgi:hypothetical protein